MTRNTTPFLFPIIVALGLLLFAHSDVRAQAPDRVLAVTTDRDASPGLTADRGYAGIWQQIQKLNTTASLFHTVAHPDDEHAGMLTLASRGQGARTALLSINRGEAGANAIGPELFDALGLIRTEELRLSARYYGLDDLYFSNTLDYGYSKTLDETLRSWDEDIVLGDMVRLLRINRPLVVVSRFHASERDGHGNHQAMGRMTPQAFHAAGDPDMFPEQITEEGLRPWQPLKLYRGGVREAEPWNIRLDVGQYSPVLGSSYQNFGAFGLSLQRSQTSGRTRQRMGPVPYYYERMDAEAGAEAGFFDGLDTSLPGLFALVGEDAPEGAVPLLSEIAAHVEGAMQGLDVSDPSAVVADLVAGLGKTRTVLEMTPPETEASFMLRIKEQQFMHAIASALGLQFTALAMPAGDRTGTSPWAPAPVMGPVVPGQEFRVEARLQNFSDVPLEEVSLSLVSGAAGPPWSAEKAPLASDEVYAADFSVQVPDDPAYSRRYFFRRSVRNNHYEVRDSSSMHLLASPPSLVAEAALSLMGESVTVRRSVQTMESNLPYGYVLRELKVAPAIAVNVHSARRVIPSEQEGGTFAVGIELLNNYPGNISGELALDTPDGWSTEPPGQEFAFSQAGQRAEYQFEVTFPKLEDPEYTLEAVATAGGRSYREGYDLIRHRDLEVRYLYKPAQVRVHGLDVRMAQGLNVGYVMGVGDEVPDGIEQLGADVHLLTSADLASGDLSAYDVIVIGTRAYAVRQDLVTYNLRLLDYAEAGGNLIVLYQTQEFVPDLMAPFPAQLPRGAEEVSEEDAPVTILEPDHAALQAPNAITLADFDDWVEQRGSKFFTEWDAAYTPLIETHDTGQDPQRGAWLIARHGDGYYTYFAIAIHRQTPYAVPGPYRIFANLLSMGRTVTD